MSSWKPATTAKNFGEATLLKNLLEQEGIAAEVRGEYRASIGGELPIPEAQVDVLVPEAEVEKARAVLSRALTQPESAPRKCPACLEENPGNFESCWKCQTDLA